MWTKGIVQVWTYEVHKQIPECCKSYQGWRRTENKKTLSTPGY